ncbi:Myb/SANT-like DNA-binding domain-containing protein [Auriculariales sp. MPI-PUGE-AT-0066]|nr:Myb/SANT-like DNA-binding domain-containing protein [Auriculariales sp. MPI-PUGE-AT-0066]
MPKPPKTGDDCVWTTEDDRLLLAHLQQEKAAGNQAQSGWKPSVWQPIMAQYAEAKGQQGGTKTKEKIKSHWQKMKSEFNTVYQLFENSSGFGYDSERKMVTAPPNVWTEKVKVNKAFARYQTAPYLWWNEMNDLVGGLSATGSGALHLAAGAPSSNPPSPPQSSLPTIKNIAQHKSTVPKSRSGSHI